MPTGGPGDCGGLCTYCAVLPARKRFDDVQTIYDGENYNCTGKVGNKTLTFISVMLK